LDFDDTNNEASIFKFVMPQHYGGGGVDLLVHYAMTSVVTGTVEWETDFERIGDEFQDIDGDGFTGSPQSSSNTVPATLGHVDVITIPHTAGAQMDSIVAGDLGRLKITRDAANDTALGDAELLAIEMRET